MFEFLSLTPQMGLFQRTDKAFYIIACEVFRPELEHLTKNGQHEVHITYLKQGLHDTPDKLRETLQEHIDNLEAEHDLDFIGLAYGFCGRGLYGITSKKATLIVPRVHDCIPVLLGTGPEDTTVRAEEFGKTYWLSAGWIKYSQLDHITEREKRYQQYIEDYGQDSADYLMEVEHSWRLNYTNACLILWDGLESEQLNNEALYVAQDMTLPLTTYKGKTWYLEELIAGGTNEKNFFHILPNHTLNITGLGTLDLEKATETK